MNGEKLKTASAEELREFIRSIRCVDCSHYNDGEFTSYDGNVYCQVCWDRKMAEEKRAREKEIKEAITKLKSLGVNTDGIQLDFSDE
jgi:hypothetical protein